MVLTRSQAAKNKANHSPEAHKVTRKQKQATAACDDLTAAAAAGARLNQLLGDKALNAQGMGSKMAKLAKLRIGPSSHPIASLPGSPAISPEPSTSQFTIPAVLQEDAQARQQQAQQQLQAGVSDALASLVAAQAADATTESLSSARSVDGKPGGVLGAAECSDAACAAPACPSPSLAAQPTDVDQRAQTSAPLPVRPALTSRRPTTWAAPMAAVEADCLPGRAGNCVPHRQPRSVPRSC
jgi:hypothetical protein